MNVRSYCAEYDLLLDTKTIATLNDGQLLLKDGLIDLCARNFTKTSLRARSSSCTQFVEPCKVL